MKLPPATVVHGLDQVRMAVTPGRPVTLLSGPGAAVYAGCGWWRALMEAAAFTGPDVLDCGDAPGHAMAALRVGCRVLVLDPAVPAWALVAGRAASVGAVLLRERPPALDLGQPGAIRRLATWLDRDDTPSPVG